MCTACVYTELQTRSIPPVLSDMLNLAETDTRWSEALSPWQPTFLLTCMYIYFLYFQQFFVDVLHLGTIRIIPIMALIPAMGNQVQTKRERERERENQKQYDLKKNGMNLLKLKHLCIEERRKKAI